MPAMLASLSFLMFLFPLSVVAEPVTRLVEGKGVSLFTVLYPKDNSETIILLHGGPGVPMDFHQIVEALSKKYQVIVFDQRGTGRSPMTNTDHSMEAYVQDMNSIAEHYKLTNFHVFGHSWGGLYAQIYAEKYPDKVLSLFLSSPASGTGEHWDQTESEVMEFNKSKTTVWQWLKMGINSVRGMLGSDGAYQSLFKQVINNYNKDFDTKFVAIDSMVEQVRALPVNETRKYILEYPLLTSPANYRFPILVQYGEKDIYGDSKQHVVGRFPQAQFVTIEQAGHLAWLNNANKFQNVLEKFYNIDDVHK
jgi:proline iminopeptidase